MKKTVKVGGLTLGGGKIYIQSMLNARAEDVEGNVAQAIELEKAGCEINRVAIPDTNAVRLIQAIKEKTTIPLVADIHFDYRLALEAVAAGIDKIRINPGNIGSDERVEAVAKACAAKNIPIRIGVNSGSLEKAMLEKYGSPTAEALVESALGQARLLERCDFSDIVISIKSSNVNTVIKAYRLLSEQCDYPLHLGVTETGSPEVGLIKSAIGIGSLLADGIGDTIRVSLTAPPVEEVFAAKKILRALGRDNSVDIISCPTCGRTKIDVISLVKQVEERTRGIHKKIKIAVMGCAVNGPGEAREADIGIAGGNGEGLIFKKGEILRKVPEGKLLEALMDELERL